MKYTSNNQNTIKLLNSAGILITSCCSHGFSRRKFKLIIDGLIDKNNFKYIDELELDKLDDHPVIPYNSESDYLKIYAIKNSNINNSNLSMDNSNN